jgi:hypothetical protein
MPERMGDNVVGHHPTMPGVGKTAQPLVPASRLEDCLHASMITIVSRPCKTMALRERFPGGCGYVVPFMELQQQNSDF